MTTEGDRVRARRERLGMHKNELAEAAGISRETVAAIEAGEGFRRASLTKIERALEAAEQEAGVDAPLTQRPADTSPGPRMVKFQLKRGDVDVVVEGPIEDIDTLAATVERLLPSVNGGPS